MIDDIVKTEKAAAKGKADIAKAGEPKKEEWTLLKLRRLNILITS